MKNLYLFLLIVFSTLCTQAQNQPFITTWEVTLSDLSITIPTHPESTYNYTVDFGDGIVLNNQTGDATHMYNTAGTYTVSITGNFPRIYFFYSNQANKRKIKSVGQWGDIQWQNMNYAFYGCENLVINATDAPNLNQVIDLTQMFAKCSNFDQSLNNWDVSTITNMEGMFKEATSFNQPLNNWDVSNVTDMEAMFLEASSFNQDLSNWSFNTNVFFSNMVDNSNLNTTNYENLLNKFYSLNLINKSFSGEGMYYCDGTIRSNLINNRGWTFYNDYQDVCGQALTPGAFVTKWLVGNNVYIYAQSANTDYNYTVNFGDGTVLNNQTSSCSHAYSSPGVYIITITGDYPRIDFGEQDNLLSVEQWGNQQWSDMYNAFKNCSKLKINATDAPDLSQVLSISSMFEGCTSLNQSINHWDVSSVHSMSRMFYGAIKYNQPLNDWDFSSVTNMSRMFYGAIKYNQPLNNWDVSSVTNMESMFQQATSFNQPLNNWDVSNVTDMGFMFWLAEDFNQPVDNWDVSNVTDMDSMFLRTTSFNQPLNLWDVSSVTNMESMFQQATSFDQPLNNWDTSNVADMESMFQQATSFDQPLNNWDVSSVTNMESMFEFAYFFNQPINNWDVSNVTNMKGMFEQVFYFNQPLNNWDTSNVTDMESMFEYAYFFNQPINNWDVSNVTNMTRMFQYALSFNQPISSWDVSNVTNMISMFGQAEVFNQPIDNWNFNPNVVLHAQSYLSPGFLSYTNMDIQNYDKLLSQFIILDLNNKVLNANGLKYCNETARNYLINELGWDIHDSGQSDNCNSIIGTIAYDENNDGCDPNDAAISGFMVNANDGSDDLLSYSINGNYELGTVGTNFTVSVVNYPSYFSVSPASQQVTFNNSNTEVADFCVTANQTMEDLNVVFIPTSEARPGFEADYQLVIENLGTQTVTNATVTLDFDDTMQSFVNASVTPTSTTTNQLTFDIANLQPLTFQTVDITMQTFQPPTVNGDDILSFTANVSPSANDFTPNDNTFLYDQTVVNSYDPNDKQVLQGEEIEIDDADEYLNYLIRFQNTGTASAINVRVLDTLHPKLDYSTLRPVNASHNYRIEITNENEVEFIFDGINLPDENTNEPASHGFVAYKIKPKNDVAVGDFITGDANIYFDFNAPIITNMVSTEIIDDLSTSNYDLANNINIYPNPTKDILNIEVKNNQEIEQLKIYNLSGLELINVKESKQQLHLESLSAGVYFLQIQTNLGTLNKRFIKN